MRKPCVPVSKSTALEGKGGRGGKGAWFHYFSQENLTLSPEISVQTVIGEFMQRAPAGFKAT